jgi:hypothetical protein
VTGRDARDAKRSIRVQVSEIRRYLNEWDPLPGGSADEYDCLGDRIIGSLHRGSSAPELTELICAWFAEHFHSPVAREEARAVSERILAWWARRSR